MEGAWLDAEGTPMPIVAPGPAGTGRGGEVEGRLEHAAVSRAMAEAVRTRFTVNVFAFMQQPFVQCELIDAFIRLPLIGLRWSRN